MPWTSSMVFSASVKLPPSVATEDMLEARAFAAIGGPVLRHGASCGMEHQVRHAVEWTKCRCSFRNKSLPSTEEYREHHIQFQQNWCCEAASS